MAIQLSDHFTYKRLLRFSLPSIVMMVFTSIYGVVDGFFVSNYVGKTPFAAVNFIMPFLMILGAFGFMLGTGGSALVAKTLGQGNNQRAKELFSLVVYTTAGLGVAVGLMGIILLPNIAQALGAREPMLSYCVLYGRLILLALPFFMLQQVFQSFFVAAQKPKLGLMSTVIAGVTNMLLDWLFMGVFRWGVAGAALATAFSQLIGGVFPLCYFGFPNGSLLRLCSTRFYGRALLQACTNGSSELMSNISMSLVGMLYNAQLMQYAGENGVAAYGVLMYISFIFIAVFIGFSIGTAPVVGFHYGADNKGELKSLRQKSLRIIGLLSLGMFVLGESLATPLSGLFVGYDAALFAMTRRGFAIFSFSFLFAGVCIYGSGFFTALNNGPISATISFMRTLVFQAGAILLLPVFFDLDGIWLSIVLAEALATLVTALFLKAKQKKYGY